MYWAPGREHSHANLAPLMVKGREVLVVGRIQTREWDQDGEKRYRKEIIADRVTLTGARPRGAASSGKGADTQRRPSRAERLAEAETGSTDRPSDGSSEPALEAPPEIEAEPGPEELGPITDEDLDTIPY